MPVLDQTGILRTVQNKAWSLGLHQFQAFGIAQHHTDLQVLDFVDVLAAVAVGDSRVLADGPFLRIDCEYLHIGETGHAELVGLVWTELNAVALEAEAVVVDGIHMGLAVEVNQNPLVLEDIDDVAGQHQSQVPADSYRFPCEEWAGTSSDLAVVVVAEPGLEGSRREQPGIHR